MSDRPTFKQAFSGENLIGFLLMIAGVSLIPFAVLALEALIS